MILSYYIKRENDHQGLVRVRFWHNTTGWSATDAKGYSARWRAERVLVKLINKGEAFADECSIEESTV